MSVNTSFEYVVLLSAQLTWNCDTNQPQGMLLKSREDDWAMELRGCLSMLLKFSFEKEALLCGLPGE